MQSGLSWPSQAFLHQIATEGQLCARHHAGSSGYCRGETRPSCWTSRENEQAQADSSCQSGRPSRSEQRATWGVKEQGLARCVGRVFPAEGTARAKAQMVRENMGLPGASRSSVPSWGQLCLGAAPAASPLPTLKAGSVSTGCSGRGGFAGEVYENSSNRVHNYFASIFYMIKNVSFAKQQIITISLMNACADSVVPYEGLRCGHITKQRWGTPSMVTFLGSETLQPGGDHGGERVWHGG